MMQSETPQNSFHRFALTCVAGFVLFLLQAGPAKAAAYDWMFETDEVAQIDLGIPPASRADLADDPGEYVPGTFQISGTGGQNFGPVPVEVRLKGSSSFRTLDGKAAFKLKFSNPNRPWGLKKITLNNMVQDSSKVHEALAYEVFRAMDVPSSKTGFANLTIDGDPYGLYLNLETLDDQSMDRWFDSLGHLYEGEAGADLTPDRAQHFEVDEGDEEDISDLENLIAVAGTDPSTWRAAVEPLADLEEMVRMWAAEVYLGQWDGYLYNTNNFYLHSDEDGRFSMLPSGLDQTFGQNFEFFLEDQEAHPRSILFRRCLAVSTCRAEYTAALIEVREVVRELQIGDFAEDLYSTIRPTLVDDPRKEDLIEESDAAIAPIGAFLALQDQVLDELLAKVPNAPVGVGVVPAAGALDVSWQAAKTRGAAPVTGYSVRYRRVGEEISSILISGNPGAGSLRIPGLRGGASYVVSVRALSDSGPGQVTKLEEPVVTGQVDVPQPEFSTVPVGIVASTRATIAFSTGPGLAAECRLNDGDWSLCASPLVLDSLGQGPQRISIRQSDPAGNLSEAVHREWSVDTVHPRLRLARYISPVGKASRAARWHRLWIATTLEQPALRVHLSTHRRKPGPRARGTVTRTLRQNKLSLRHRHRIRWARVEDQAGNTSAWKQVRPKP